MAFIFRDYVGPLMENFKRNTAIYHKFDKAWGKGTDGYYVQREIWAKNEGRWFKEDVRWRRFLNAIGVTINSLKSNDFEEIEYCYFFLNPNRISEELKGTSSPADLEELTGITREDIAGAINQHLITGDKLQVMTTYSGSTKKIIAEHEEEWSIIGEGVNRTITTSSLNSNAVIDTILADRWLYYGNIVTDYTDRDSLAYNSYDGSALDYTDDYGEGTIALNRSTGDLTPATSPPCYTWMREDEGSILHSDSSVDYFALAMLDHTESCFTTTKVDGVPKVYNDVGTYAAELPISDTLDTFGDDGSLIIHPADNITSTTDVVSSYTFGFEYTFNGATASSRLVENIYNNMYLMFSRDRRNNGVANTIQKTVLYDIYSIRNSNLFTWAEYFVDGRLSIEKAASMKRFQFANLISDCLDSDVKAEDPSFWEKLIAVVVVIIAIVIVIYSAGTAAPASATLTASASTMTALATGLGYASLVLTIGALVLSQMGLSAQGLVKFIGKVAQITGIAAAVIGLISAGMRMFAQAAAEAGKTTANYTVQEFITDTTTKFIDNITKAATSSLRSVFDLLTDPMGVLMGTNTPGTPLTPTGWLSRLDKGAQMYQKLFASSSDTATAPTDEQLQRADFQYPQDMFTFQERTIYEPDALEKIDILKQEQLGGSKTEDLMQRIA